MPESGTKKESIIMAFNASTSGHQIIEYSPDDTFSALLTALSNSSHYTVKDSNKSARTIMISTGVSWKSWGENLNIAISPANDGFSEVSIHSSSKFGVADWGKNQENFNTILNLLAIELEQYEKVTQATKTVSDDIPTQIKKLADLRDAGILTETEFQTKKADLLAKM